MKDHNTRSNDPKSPGRTDRDKRDANRDPITGAPGAHPVGAGAGAAAGAAAGGVAGSFVGPVGTVVGAAVGGIAGGLAGKGIAEQVNPTEEDAYWRDNWNKRDYTDKNKSYDEYAPAYRAGWEGCCSYGAQGKTFDQAEPSLRSEWDTRRGNSSLNWDSAKPACRDAWNRVEPKIHKA
jgi:hypothetical protein